jgi:hypothetical protein
MRWNGSQNHRRYRHYPACQAARNALGVNRCQYGMEAALPRKQIVEQAT